MVGQGVGALPVTKVECIAPLLELGCTGWNEAVDVPHSFRRACAATLVIKGNVSRPTKCALKTTNAFDAEHSLARVCPMSCLELEPRFSLKNASHCNWCYAACNSCVVSGGHLLCECTETLHRRSGAHMKLGPVLICWLMLYCTCLISGGKVSRLMKCVLRTAKRSMQRALTVPVYRRAFA